MNALTKIENTALTTMTEPELMQVLQSSLYPGASPDSVRLVLGYCKAAALDPMQKPVHIVPMKVSTGQKDANGWDIKAMRDVIMPGVGLYRTQAARTGQYAGMSDPEYGPTRTLTFKAERWEDGENNRRVKRYVEETIEYPEWCRVSVRRIVGGVMCEFPAREYWLENYATKGDGVEPNAMWRKRPFGQLSKCAEAQALRKAFPEQTGSQPTAEEMEGKTLDAEDQPPALEGGRKPAVATPQAKKPGAAHQEPAGDVDDVTPKGETPPPASGALATVGEIAYITKKLAAHSVTIAAAREAIGMEAGETLEGLTKDGFLAMKDAYK
jgi:phage recombination protein Bet